MSKFVIINTNNKSAKQIIGKIGTRVQGKIGSHAIIHLQDGTVWETSSIQNIQKHDGFCRIQTRNSYYEFERVLEKVQNPCEKHYIIENISADYDYDVSKEPWAKRGIVSHPEKDLWRFTSHETFWFDSKEELEIHKKIHDDVPIIKIGTWTFDEEFLEKIKYWSKEIHGYGAFAFDLRKELRKKYKNEIYQNYSKLGLKNCLSYFRQFC